MSQTAVPRPPLSLPRRRERSTRLPASSDSSCDDESWPLPVPSLPAQPSPGFVMGRTDLRSSIFPPRPLILAAAATTHAATMALPRLVDAARLT